METGTRVGAGRCPHLYGNKRGKPWAGVVLDKCDPKAWAETIAFGSRKPTRAEVAEHLARVGGVPSYVPVLWSFGESGTKVYWERAESLRPYAEDLAQWERENG